MSKRGNFKLYGRFDGYAPGWGGAAALLGMMAAGALCGNAAVLALGSVLPAEWLQLIGYVIMFVPPMLYAAAKSARQSARFDAVRKPLDTDGFGELGAGLCCIFAVLATFCASFVAEPVTHLLPKMPKELESLLDSMTQGSLALNLLCVSVFAPLCEEWLCRGMVLRGLLCRGVRPAAAVAFSALFFALIHMNPWQAVPAFLLGCLFGYVYSRTGSLKLTMLMHCTNNTLCVIFGRIDAFKDAETWMDVLKPGPLYWGAFALCFIVLAVCVLQFRKLAFSFDKQC